MGNFYLKKVTFNAWLEDYKETRQAKRWFNLKTKVGEENGEEDGEWYWQEGEDPISVLPSEVSIKVWFCFGCIVPDFWFVVSQVLSTSYVSHFLFLLRFSAWWVFVVCAAVHKCAGPGRRSVRTRNCGIR